MENVRIMENYGVFLRACEGLPVLILMMALLAVSYYFRNSTKF
ncbi:hypothetical protein [Methanoregula sp.]